MKAKLSVIMPAYNAAKYIERSMESVLSQGHDDLELIVINDGSTDDTAAVVSRAAEKDSRVRLITVENGGPAMARNHGLDSISEESDYVMFIDADDELLPGAVDYALSAAADGALPTGPAGTILSRSAVWTKLRWVRPCRSSTWQICSIRSGQSCSVRSFCGISPCAFPTTAGAKTGSSSLTALRAPRRCRCCRAAATSM